MHAGYLQAWFPTLLRKVTLGKNGGADDIIPFFVSIIDEKSD